MSNELNEEVGKMNPLEAACEAVDAWHDGDEEKKADVLGSYTGMTAECEAPEQDADDL